MECEICKYKQTIEEFKRVMGGELDKVLKPLIVSEDGPEIRRNKLMLRLKGNPRPIKPDQWRLFVDCLEKHLAYKNPDDGQPVDYLLNRLSTNTVNPGLVDHLLTMVIE
jgi:hypothetical protein